MFSIEVPFFNLDQTYLSGQTFRWIRLKGGKYVIQHRDKVLRVEQIKGRLLLNCDEKQFNDVWFDYFDLGTNYEKPNARLQFCNEYLKLCSVRAKGVHILKQDVFETIIASIISEGRSTPECRAIIDSLCSICGIAKSSSMRDWGRVKWFEFPTPLSIIENADDLERRCPPNVRDKIVNVCYDIEEGWLDTGLLQELSYDEAKEYLLQFETFNSDNAEYICLHSLHHLQAAPTNAIINDALQREFDVQNFSDARDWVFPELVGKEGLVYQYILFNELNQPQEE